MATIPSHCHSCGAVFESRMLSIEGNVKGLTLSNNSETCPFCGGRAYLAEGVFDIANDVVSVLQAPHVTVEMLKKLGNAVIEAYEDESKTEELRDVAKSIDPKLAATVEGLTSKKPLAALGLFLLAMAIKSCSVDATVDVNELIDQLKNEPPQTVNIERYRV